MDKFDYETTLSKREDLITTLQNTRQHQIGKYEPKQEKEEKAERSVSQYTNKARAGREKVTAKRKIERSRKYFTRYSNITPPVIERWH